MYNEFEEYELYEHKRSDKVKWADVYKRQVYRQAISRKGRRQRYCTTIFHKVVRDQAEVRPRADGLGLHGCEEYGIG